MNYPKRLIEVDLPIRRISAHARREKSIRHGHISTLHIWWARRPLAACRAVICAALWPDPADDLCPAAFRTAAERIILDFARKVTTDTKLPNDHCSPENFKRWQKLTFLQPLAFSLSAYSVLDRVHQSMILFAAGRNEALKRFLVEDGAGNDQRFWRLVQALSALYPASADEKRWVDGVLARKKRSGIMTEAGLHC